MGVRGIFAIAVALSLPIAAASAAPAPTLICQRSGEVGDGGTYVLSNSGSRNGEVVDYHYQRLTGNRVSCADAHALAARVFAAMARNDQHPSAPGFTCTLLTEASGLRRASCASHGGLRSVHFLFSYRQVTGQRANDDTTCIELAGSGAPSAHHTSSGCEVVWHFPQDQNEPLLELLSSTFRNGGLGGPFTARTPGRIQIALDLDRNQPLASLDATWTVAITSTAFAPVTPAGHAELHRLITELKRHQTLHGQLKLSLKFTPSG